MSEPVMIDPEKAMMGIVLLAGLMTLVIVWVLFTLGVCR